MRFPIRIVTPLLALLLTACGAEPSAAPRPQVERPQPAPVAPPEVDPTTGASPERAMMARSQAAFMAMRGYEAELLYFQKGTKASNGIYEIAGRTPRKLRIHIKQGTGEGAKLLWEGAQKLKVRPGGLLSAVVLDMPLTDKRFMSVRNYTLEQTDIHSMYAMMMDPANTPAPAGPDTVTLTGPKLLKGCVKMLVKFDPATSLPTQVELNDPKEVVFRLKLRNLRRNDNVSLAL